jgi:hypothetical protein
MGWDWAGLIPLDDLASNALQRQKYTVEDATGPDQTSSFMLTRTVVASYDLASSVGRYFQVTVHTENSIQRFRVKCHIVTSRSPS